MARSVSVEQRIENDVDSFAEAQRILMQGALKSSLIVTTESKV